MTAPRIQAGTIKFLIGWALCFLVRFWPGRPPNIEPVMTAVMPFGRNMGPVAGFVFGAASIVFFDVASDAVGIWTLVTAVAYGLVGIGAHYALRSRKDAPVPYILYAFMATVFYDIVTGVLMGPVLFGGSMREAFIGQIPFTVNHLVGNVVLAGVVSPLLSRWIVRNERLEWRPLSPARMR